MSHVAVEKVRGSDASPPSLLEKMQAVTEKVRQRAYDLFQKHGATDGFALEDWLQAERDVVLSPEAELIEKDGKYRIRLAVPGFDGKDIQVTAMPNSLVVCAESSHKHEKDEGEVYLCEFSERKLFRTLVLPAAIDTDKVTANLDHGILHLTAEKAEQSAKNKVKVIAAA